MNNNLPNINDFLIIINIMAIAFVGGLLYWNKKRKQQFRHRVE